MTYGTHLARQRKSFKGMYATTCALCGAPVKTPGKGHPRYEPAAPVREHQCQEATAVTTVDDFLGINDVPRDRWDRPLIQPVGGGTPEPYSRISGFAGTLDDAGGLITWKARNAALSMSRHPDLAAMVAALTFTGDKKADRAVNKTLDAHVETGICRVSDAAAHGTAVHSFTEPDASPFIPDRMQADVASYHQALEDHGLRCVEAERFVVNDHLKVAGTFDGIYEHPTLGRLVGDKKTGSVHAQAVAVQLACYAGASYYDIETHERTPLDVRQDIGLVLHIPRGEGRTDLHLVDLEAGRAAAKAAAWVCAWRKRDDLLTHFDPLTVASLAS